MASLSAFIAQSESDFSQDEAENAPLGQELDQVRRLTWRRTKAASSDHRDFSLIRGLLGTPLPSCWPAGKSCAPVSFCPIDCGPDSVELRLNGEVHGTRANPPRPSLASCSCTRTRSSRPSIGEPGSRISGMFETKTAAIFPAIGGGCEPARAAGDQAAVGTRPTTTAARTNSTA